MQGDILVPLIHLPLFWLGSGCCPRALLADFTSPSQLVFEWSANIVSRFRCPVSRRTAKVSMPILLGEILLSIFRNLLCPRDSFPVCRNRSASRACVNVWPCKVRPADKSVAQPGESARNLRCAVPDRSACTMANSKLHEDRHVAPP